MRAIAEYGPMDRARFEREIVPKGEPAVFRGLVADWPAVRAARDGPEALARMLNFAATDEPFQAWFAPPEVEGRFNYNADFSGFNFERKLARPPASCSTCCCVDADDRPHSICAGGIPIRKHLPALVPNISGDDPGYGARYADLAMDRQPHPHCDALGPVTESRLRRGRATAVHVFPPEQLKNLYVGPLELKAWRNMFDHYVFGDGDPVEHLPDGARGLLGKRTPELVARVKKLLIGVLRD